MSISRALANAIGVLTLASAITASWADTPGPTPPPLPNYAQECAHATTLTHPVFCQRLHGDA